MARKTNNSKPLSKKLIMDMLAMRQFVYTFLTRSFIEEPSRDFVELLSSEEMMEAFPFIEESEMLRGGVEALSFYLRDPDLLSTKNMDDLAADFTNLFVGPNKVKAPPWESIYVSDQRLVFRDETIDVRNTYAKQSLIPKNIHLEPDDHISLELDFLVHLTKRALTELRANKLSHAKRTLTEQKKFMQSHLLKWVSDLAGNVRHFARTDFYRGTANILEGFVGADYERLKTLIGELDIKIKKQKEAKQKEAAVGR